MSFRFRRRIRIAPGVTLKLSKSGGSLSFGPRGAKFTIGARGKRATVGIPGTGLFYTTTLPSGRSGGRKRVLLRSGRPTVGPEDRLTLGFFRRLMTPDDEEALVGRVPGVGAEAGAADRGRELPGDGRREAQPLRSLLLPHMRHHGPPHHGQGTRAGGRVSAA